MGSFLHGWIRSAGNTKKQRERLRPVVEILEDRSLPALLLPGSLSGSVFCDDNNNGLRDPGETGIAGVPIILRGGNQVPQTRTTDANGAYRFVNLYPGVYSITEGTIPAGAGVTGDGGDSLGRIPGASPNNWGRANQNDTFTGIRIRRGQNGINYNFGEQCFVAQPAISLVKFVNGQDANTAPGVFVVLNDQNPAARQVTFTYQVRNTGNVPLQQVAIIDDNGTPGNLADDFSPTFTGGDTNNNGLLDLNETWTYSVEPRDGQLGLQTNIATVSARDALNTLVTDTDPANYTGFFDDF